MMKYDFIGVGKKLRHSILLPLTLSCLITGPSGCGKIKVLIALLEPAHGLQFQNIYYI